MRQVLRGLRHSLRTRLLVGTLVWVMVSVLVAGWVLSDLFRQHAARQLASELAVHMNTDRLKTARGRMFFLFGAFGHRAAD